jgi:hypothetical protein
MASAPKVVYKSKISWGLVLFICLAFAVPLGFMLADGVWLGVAILLLSAWLPISIFRNTSYTLTHDKLQISCGFLYNQSIPVASIRSIQPSRNIISSPALSLDRQQIKFGKYDSVLISLKDEDKEDFYGRLKRLNPNIEFK